MWRTRADYGQRHRSPFSILGHIQQTRLCYPQESFRADLSFVVVNGRINIRWQKLLRARQIHTRAFYVPTTIIVAIVLSRDVYLHNRYLISKHIDPIGEAERDYFPDNLDLLYVAFSYVRIEAI